MIESTKMNHIDFDAEINDDLSFDLDVVINQHLHELFGVPQFSNHRNNYAKILNELVNSQRKFIEESKYPSYEAEELVNKAADLIYDFASTVTQNTKDHRKQKDPDLEKIWVHKNLSLAFHLGYQSNEAAAVPLEDLEAIGAGYLDQDMRSATYEILLVDSFIASEVFLYGEEIKEHPSCFGGTPSFERLIKEEAQYAKTKGNKDKLDTIRFRDRCANKILLMAFLIGLPYLTAIYLEEIEHVSLSSWVYSYVYVVISIIIFDSAIAFFRLFFGFNTSIDEATVLHSNMIACYEELNGVGLSPTRIKDQLSKTADLGAVWKPVVYSLLDTAILRGKGYADRE